MREKAYLKQDVKLIMIGNGSFKLTWHDIQTNLMDTAQAFIDIARNSSMTGQRIQVGSSSNFQIGVFL